MKIGVMSGFGTTTSPEFIAAAGRTAEERGFHSFWVPEHVLFFPWLCAFNARWYEGPSDQAIILDDSVDAELLSDRTMANYDEDHSSLYHDFPPFLG